MDPTLLLADPHNPEIDEDISLTCYGAVLGQSKSVQKQLSLHSDILKEKDFRPRTVAWMDGDLQRIKMVHSAWGSSISDVRLKGVE